MISSQWQTNLPKFYFAFRILGDKLRVSVPSIVAYIPRYKRCSFARTRRMIMIKIACSAAMLIQKLNEISFANLKWFSYNVPANVGGIFNKM